MLSRTAKETFYKLAGPLMRANAIFYKHFRSPQPGQYIRVHLGPGQKNIYRDGSILMQTCLLASVIYGLI